MAARPDPEALAARLFEWELQHVPGERTRLTYYVDDALKEAGFAVRIGVNPSAVKVIYEPGVGLLTGNGPQGIDAQARRLRSIVWTRPALSDARLSA